MTKTNAMRQLERAGIPFDVLEYEVDEKNLSGVHVAGQLGQNPDQVFKTLVLQGDKTGYLVCCIPVMEELDLKKIAAISRNKKVDMIPKKELLSVTGYVRGGCSPIGMKKQFPTYIDETAVLYEEIMVSAGIRGEQIVIEPNVLQKFVHAIFQDLIQL